MSVLKLNNIKQRNLASALRVFCEHDGISRREAAALIQCDHATTTRTVKSLLDMEFLAPAGKRETAHGRPREMLSLHPAAPLGIGIEIQENAVSGVVSDLTGRVKEVLTVAIGEGDPQLEFERAFCECVSTLIGWAKGRLFGIAVAAIGSFAPESSVIVECANYPELNGWDLEKFWRQNFAQPLPYFTDRLLAEMHWFLAREPELKDGVSILIDAGIGIGMAMSCQGTIVSLARRHGGEFGHNTVIPHGELCRCGRKGCLEAYVSTARLIKQHNCRSWDELLEHHCNSQTVLQAAELFGISLANQINNLLPDHAVITGDFITLGTPATEIICRTVEEHLFSASRNVELILRPGAADAAAGAALLAREEFFRRFSAGEWQ